MEAVSLDSLQAISTFASSCDDMYKDLRSRPSTTTIKSFRMDKDFEYSMKGMEKEVKQASPTRLSSNILSSSSAAPSLDIPSEETVDPIWGQRYETQPSLSSFSSSKRSHLQSNKKKGKGKTKLSKFGQYSAVVANNNKKKSSKKKMSMPLSELKLKEVQLISTLGKLRGNSPDKGVSVTFGDITPIVEKHSRKNVPIKNPAAEDSSDNESIDTSSSIGTSSTAESSQYDEELATVLSRIQLATTQPSVSYKFGDGLSDCDLVDEVVNIDVPGPEKEETKEFVQQPQADHLLAVQEESLRKAMERQRKKESSLFW
ncbi:unnamed protein product [Cylindrotheca closterium]|uniref:Uncharacterized protein n=1 Tax=Cylindrotheca closterium TaxID=2856 RepID=A0AAD2G3R8_9STRA|nr:unnamed protein product [Cylindrotheca closterium]